MKGHVERPVEHGALAPQSRLGQEIVRQQGQHERLSKFVQINRHGFGAWMLIKRILRLFSLEPDMRQEAFFQGEYHGPKLRRSRLAAFAGLFGAAAAIPEAE